MEVLFKEFNQVIRMIDTAYHDACLKLGISDSDFDILYGICEHGEGCKQSDLYKSLGQKKTTINSSLKKMEKMGYVYTTRGDGRNTKVFLTPEGRKLSNMTAERIIKIENEIFGAWTKEEQNAMVGLNQKYLEEFLAKVEEELK